MKTPLEKKTVKPLRAFTANTRSDLRTALYRRTETALSAHNLTLRFDYETLMETATGMPLAAIEKLQSLEQPVTAGLIIGKAYSTYFQGQGLRFMFMLEGDSGWTTQTAVYTIPDEQMAQMFKRNFRVLNLVALSNCVKELTKTSSSLSVDHVYSISPALSDLIDHLLPRMNFARGKAINLPQKFMPHYVALRKHETTMRELIAAPKQYQPPVLVGGYKRWLYL